jgi:(S)-2-hydroxy-acid oxidase
VCVCVDRRTSSVKDENIGLFFLFLVVTMNGERFTPVNTFEYEALAKLKLPKMVYDYYASGADDEYTLEDNIAAFRRIRLRPRVLVDISAQDISTTLLGIPSSFPLVIAPAAMQKMVSTQHSFSSPTKLSCAGSSGWRSCSSSSSC